MAAASPLVSVLISNYNYAPFVQQCIESVLQQTYQNTEIIVYDDGSTDNSVEVIERFGDKIIFINPKKNFGAPSRLNQINAINEAYRRSKGDIICLLDSDDYFAPQKIEKVVAAFVANPRASLVQHPMQEVNGEGLHLPQLRPPHLLPPDITNGNLLPHILQHHNLFRLFALTSGLCASRTFLEQVMPLRVPDRYDETCVDVRVSRLSVFYGETVTLYEPLAYYRIHGNNWIHQLHDKDFLENHIQQMYDLFNEWLQERGYPPIDLNKNTYRKKKGLLQKLKSMLFFSKK